MSQLKVVFDGESLITPDAMAGGAAAGDYEHFDEQLAIGRGEIAVMLELARQRWERADDPRAIIDYVAGALHDIRSRLHPIVWKALVPVVQRHPVSALFLEDPFTRWSFEKPRGYSGDAHLLDFIYGHPDAEAEIAAATPTGKALYDYTKDASSSVAVRERRDLLTKYVDQVADARGPETEILTIASGHLREADRSVALREQRLKRWIALDQDPLSVGSVARDFQGTCVEAVNGSVRSILNGKQKLGKFDFVYAAGLYDYLADNVAVKLTQKCLEMLKPGGLFLFANFAEGIRVEGYMETFMNWELLWRNEADMWRIVNASIDRNAVEPQVWFGENRNIVYGTLQLRT